MNSIANTNLTLFLIQGGQQSQVIFDDPESLKKFPKFKDAKAVEAILEPGDVLYLPPLWFHHVTALDMSVSVTVWSRPPETVNMWQAERTPFPVSKNASAEERALVLRIYMDLVLEKILGPDAAKPFVEALLEQRFQNIIDEVRLVMLNILKRSINSLYNRFHLCWQRISPTASLL